jgi:glutathione peroxidase
MKPTMIRKKKKYRVLKRTIIILLLLFISFCIYVAVVNKHSKQMSIRQKVLKAVYPAYVWMKKSIGKGATVFYNDKAIPQLSFYTLTGTTISGKKFDLAALKGKKVLLVNTASDCGYTAQYDELEKLFQLYNNKLAVIGFPSNDFKEQEKGSDGSIEAFCKNNYNISFMLMKKSVVVQNDRQHEIYKWLTDATKNGWNSQQPEWNFSKYLVNEDGMLVNYFGPAISPLSKEVVNAVEGK